ncbi:hypothetical protein FO519_006528 [Halicephalobus sp. NKZ332]|nr:hypothetical protein FO519_006528 [Halicephalobus sp. NKZ332]
MAPQVGFSRTALIERLMKENPLNDPSESVPIEEERFSPRKRSWTEMALFIKDNLLEVEQKIQQIETQIWGKLIIMEKNFRTAKAYLRNPVIIVDGSNEEFDGVKLGLNHFENHNRDTITELELKLLQKGIRIQLDEAGNIWMKKNGGFEKKISVKTKQKREPIFISEDFKKVFDLRNFKESVISNLSSENSDKKRLRESAMIFLKLSDSGNEDLLKNPVWCCLIHLIAVDMVDAVASEFGHSPHNSLIRNLVESQSPSNGSHSSEESSAKLE